MDRGMVFGPVVGRVDGARSSVLTKFPLCVLAPQPVEAHVHQLFDLRGDPIGEDSVHCRIVCLHGSI